MMKKNIEIAIDVINTDALSESDKRLRDAAIEASKNAYAPYSQFNVGAAVLLEDGTIVKGSNQENAAYPSGLCAERTALFAAGASFPDKAVVALAIVAVKSGEIQPSISPCGACRQVLLETEQRYNKPIRVLMCGKDDILIIQSAKDLLPLCFGKENL